MGEEKICAWAKMLENIYGNSCFFVQEKLKSAGFFRERGFFCGFLGFLCWKNGSACSSVSLLCQLTSLFCQLTSLFCRLAQ